MSNAKRIQKNYQKLADLLSMKFDPVSDVVYDNRNGFDLMIYAEDKSSPYCLTLQTAAHSPVGAVMTNEELEEFRKSQKEIRGFEHERNNFKVQLYLETKMEKAAQRAAYAINLLMNFMNERGYVPCCSICEKEGELSAYTISGSYYNLCPDCTGNLRERITAENYKKQQKKENVVGGIVGALLGSLAGVLCIVLLGQLGYIAAVSGAVMAVCVLKGYERFGGKLSKKGIVISIIVMLAMTYVGYRTDWAVSLFREVGGFEGGVSPFECYRMIPLLIAEEVIDATGYWGNLFLIYLLLLVGAVPTIRSRTKAEKLSGDMKKIGAV